MKLTMCSLPLTGDTLFQMAEVHRQIQVQLEDVVRLENPSFSSVHVQESVGPRATNQENFSGSNKGLLLQDLSLLWFLVV